MYADECSICLECLHINVIDVIYTNCKHYFHNACLTHHVLVNGNICPNCRCVITPDVITPDVMTPNVTLNIITYEDDILFCTITVCCNAKMRVFFVVSVMIILVCIITRHLRLSL